MTQIWALRSRLEKQPTDLRRRHHYMRDGTLGHQVSAARSQPYYLDVTHPAANKGSVVDFLSAVYLIPASCIAAIGDMPNDILMFEKSGMSIAMGNARNLSKEKLTLLVTETKKKVLRMPWRSLYWGRSK
jgi:hydroxymethylpyrimidine pyrophosphatase-like HAD family hydrolase